MTKRYTIYIDESGDHSYNQLNDHPGRRFLALVGIIIENDYYHNVFCSRLFDLKKKYFEYEPEKVVLHRSDIINKKKAFKVFQNETLRVQFDQDLVELIANTNFYIIGVVIDKQAHKDKYNNPFPPYHYCLKLLLERYVGFLEFNKSVGDVIVESRDTIPDKALQKEYGAIFSNGTEYIKKEKFQEYLTSGQLKLKKKAALYSGLELADLLAYSVKDDILIEQKIIKAKGNFGSKFINIIQGKYCWKGKKFI